ncbi:MAG: bifunctional oligoribonuclease/PAP phosphatase NrnA [Deltaproteobacteria bacterium]|nr:bifunctional oligoribonuclease/PAP phosphatase NrnA [Deltaproteobacteria bacterium]
MSTFTQVIAALKQAKRILIGSHYNPDGDALGSAAALGIALERQGKKVTFFNRDPVPFNLTFLPHADRFVRTLPKDASFDTVVIVDCNAAKRVGGDFEKAIKGTRVICIDHHQLEKTEGDLTILEPDAAATGVLIMRFLEEAKIPLDRILATCLFCAITVDTGSFRYSNATPDVFLLGAKLVKAGADPYEISKALEENYPAKRYRLLAKSLATLQVDEQLGIASIDVTQQMFKETGTGPDLTEEFSSFPRSIRGVEVALFFRELPDGRLKVSMRSKGHVDVAKIAAGFGGGGHVHAAGCTFEGDAAIARKKLYAALAAAIGKKGT